jgi:hypothetical protein
MPRIDRPLPGKFRGGSAVVLAYALGCAAIGLSVSYLLSAPRGADHSCPSGSSVQACHYPPDQTSWSIIWTIAGLMVGLLLGFAARAALQRRSR